MSKQDNVAIAIQIINGLISVSVNALAATAAYAALVEKSRAEGRDISDAELAELRRENQALTDKVLSELE